METMACKLVEGAKPQAERTHTGARMDRYLRSIDTFPSFFKLDSAPISLSAPLPPASLPSFPSQRRHWLPHLTWSAAPLGSVKTWPLQLQLFYPGDAVGEECKTSKYDTSGDEEWQCLGGDGVVGGDANM